MRGNLYSCLAAVGARRREMFVAPRGRNLLLLLLVAVRDFVASIKFLFAASGTRCWPADTSSPFLAGIDKATPSNPQSTASNAGPSLLDG